MQLDVEVSPPANIIKYRKFPNKGAIPYKGAPLWCQAYWVFMSSDFWSSLILVKSQTD